MHYSRRTDRFGNREKHRQYRQDFPSRLVQLEVLQNYLEICYFLLCCYSLSYLIVTLTGVGFAPLFPYPIKIASGRG